MKYARVLSEVFRKPWAILPEKLHAIAEIVARASSGQGLTVEELNDRLAPAREQAAARPGAGDYGVVAVIPIRGVISQKINLMTNISGGTSIEKLTAAFRSALADPSIKAIVFDVDSPGGGVEGVPELAEEIFKSRGQKKTIALANPMAGSAAYWLASAAEEFVVIPSGQVGSIGVFVAHEDVSKALETEGVKISLISAGAHKTDGNPYEPLSDEARADLQNKVDAFYSMFVKSVADGRGVKPSAVKNGFGQGRMVLAGDAVKAGMVDRIATFDQTVARLGGAGAPRRISAASASLLADLEDGDPDLECACECAACLADDCENCTNTNCEDLVCQAEGCPNQTEPEASASAYKAKPIGLLRRELDMHRSSR
jgi:capsid assembly protease